MVKRFGLQKSERLKSRRQIEDLFTGRKRLSVFPVTVSYHFYEATGPSLMKIGVTASKKNFKKAVDRNRIKRLLREAYRLQKNDLVTLMKQKHVSGHLFLIYTDKAEATFDIIQAAVNICLQRLQQKLPS